MKTPYQLRYRNQTRMGEQVIYSCILWTAGTLDQIRASLPDTFEVVEIRQELTQEFSGYRIR